MGGEPMKRGLGLLVLGGAALAAGAAEKGPVLPGTLGYFRDGRYYLAPASGGRERELPALKGAGAASLSPDGKSLLFFKVRENPKANDYDDPVGRAFASRAPFIQARPLPAPADRVTIPTLTWSPDSRLAFVTSSIWAMKHDAFTYRAAEGTLSPSRFPVQTSSRDGQVKAWANDAEVALLPAGARKPVILFSSAHPAPMEAAIHRARPAGKFKSFVRDLREAKADDLQLWSNSPAALSPDGKQLYFASNARTNLGASGGTTWCFFRVDLATRRLSVLPGPGTFEGMRIAEWCQVSPDGKKLLFLCVGHGSAVENTRFVYVVDLQTQQVRELLNNGIHKGDTNFVDGMPCWSPDSRYVALDVFYYRVNYEDAGIKIRVRKPGGGWAEVTDDEDWAKGHYDVRIFNAGTGSLVRTIKNASCPSWAE